MKNHLILPTTILLSSIILGGFYYASEASKQASIEKQQQIDLQAKEKQQELDLQAKQAEQQAITEKDNLIASQKVVASQQYTKILQQCLQKAKDNALQTFQVGCASEQNTEEDKNTCHQSTFADFEGFVNYEKMKSPNGEAVRLWNSYQADITKCGK